MYSVEELTSVTVAGEFASGKSTLINALLGQPLLAVGTGPTTTRNTLLEYAEAPSLSFTLDGRALTVRPNFPCGDPEIRAALSGSDLADLGQYGWLFTERCELSERITDVRYRVPAPVLAGGIHLVDTPGLGSDVPVAETALAALAEADAVLVAISPHSPAGSSLLAALANAVPAERLRNALFILTRLDEIAPEERAELVRRLRQRISERLEVPDPFLVGVAARPVLRGPGAGTPEAHRQAWAGLLDGLSAALPGWAALARDTDGEANLHAAQEAVTGLDRFLREEEHKLVQKLHEFALFLDSEDFSRSCEDLPSSKDAIREAALTIIGKAHAACATVLAADVRETYDVDIAPENDRIEVEPVPDLTPMIPASGIALPLWLVILVSAILAAVFTGGETMGFIRRLLGIHPERVLRTVIRRTLPQITGKMIAEARSSLEPPLVQRVELLTQEVKRHRTERESLAACLAALRARIPVDEPLEEVRA